jgi:hypothetical protein
LAAAGLLRRGAGPWGRGEGDLGDAEVVGVDGGARPVDAPGLVGDDVVEADLRRYWLAGGIADEDPDVVGDAGNEMAGLGDAVDLKLLGGDGLGDGDLLSVVGGVGDCDGEFDEGVALLEGLADEVGGQVEVEGVGSVGGGVAGDLGELGVGDVEGAGRDADLTGGDGLAEKVPGGDGAGELGAGEVEVAVGGGGHLELRQDVALHRDGLGGVGVGEGGLALVVAHVDLIGEVEVGPGRAEVVGLDLALEDLVALAVADLKEAGADGGLEVGLALDEGAHMD